MPPIYLSANSEFVKWLERKYDDTKRTYLFMCRYIPSSKFMSPIKYNLSNSYVEAEFTLHSLVDGLSHFIMTTILVKGSAEVQANLSPETWQKAYYIPKMCVNRLMRGRYPI